MNEQMNLSWLRGALLPGERLLWTGRAGKLVVDFFDEGVMIPILLLVGGGVAYVKLKINETGILAELICGALGVLAVGIFLWRMLQRGKRSRNTLYALTDRRLLEKRGEAWILRDLRELPEPSLEPRRNGAGDIVFPAPEGEKQAKNGKQVFPELLNIPNAEAVKGLILQARAQAFQYQYPQL